MKLSEKMVVSWLFPLGLMNKGAWEFRGYNQNISIKKYIYGKRNIKTASFKIPSE
jgi:hypothetical protein